MQDSNPTNIDFSEAREIFEGDKKGLYGFLEGVIKDLEVVESDLTSAYDNSNLRTYRDAVHKTGTIVQIFKADNFKTLLQDAKIALQSGDDSGFLDSKNAVFASLAHLVGTVKEEMRQLSD